MRRDQDHVGVRCVLVVLVLAMAPAAAMAYIDPGNGAYMVQALFALVGAALFYLRHPIQSLKTFWGWLASRRGHPASTINEPSSDELSGRPVGQQNDVSVTTPEVE